MPFQFEPYDYRGSQTIGALMQMPAAARAQALRQSGLARARAMETSGNAWSGAAQNIGQTVAGTIGDIMRYKELEPQRRAQAQTLEANAMRLEQEKRAEREQGVERGLMPLALIMDKDGVMTYDENLLTREFTVAGLADRVPGVLKSVRDSKASILAFKKAQQDLEDYQRDTVANLAYGALEAGGTVEAVQSAIRILDANGVVSQAEALKALGDATSDDQMREKLTALARLSPSIRQEMETKRGRMATEGLTRTLREQQAMPIVGSFEDYVIRKFGPQPTPEQIAQARREYAEPARAVVAPPTPPAVGSFEDFVTQKFGPRPTSEQIATARREYAEAGTTHIAGMLNPAMPSQYQTAVQRAILSIPVIRQGLVVNAANRLWTEGNEAGLRDVIRQAAIESEPVDMRNQIMGRQATLGLMTQVREDLQALKEAGVPTNWFVGSLENLVRRVGKTQNPQYATLANELMGTLIQYRRAATGVQFSQRESEDYQRMFPNYKNDLPVNLALIEGLERQMQSNDRVYWTHKLGTDGAALVMGGGNNSATATTPLKIGKYTVTVEP